MILGAPLGWGGNRPLPLLLLELGALGLLACLCWRANSGRHLSWPLCVGLLLLFGWPLLQLLPLPVSWWAVLPGRDFYAEALAQAQGEPLAGWRAASLIPERTEAAWLALLPPLLVFLVAVGLHSRDLQTLIQVFLGMAVFQALLGLIQFGDGPDSLYRLSGAGTDSAVGTYVNRNHLAGLLEMALPLALAWLTATLGQRQPVGYSPSRRQRGWLRRLAGLNRWSLNQAMVYGAACLAILLGLIFTRSRAGIVLTMLGILLCMVAFARRLGGKNVYGTVGTVTFAALLLAVIIGLTPVLNRFTLADPASDARWPIFASTLQAAAHFFPFGSGAGTFVEVYPRFHPPELVVGLTINRAHNDYLEGFLETGLLGAITVVILLACYVRQWPRVWRVGSWHTFSFLQVGAGIGLLLLALHSLVDFNLRIPANAIYFALLAAVFFHRLAERQPALSGREAGAPAEREGGVPAGPGPSLALPANMPNPFAD